jgi:hypothetical protein
MYCLTANGETFVAPEPDLGTGWSCPDFVAIRPPKKKVYVVEVTASGNPVGLIEKINAREEQWLRLLRQHLKDRGITDDTWSYSVLVFVRRDQQDWVHGKIHDKRNVTVLSLEEASANWEWSDNVWTSSFSFETDALKRSA